MKKILTILMFVAALVGGVQAQTDYYVVKNGTVLDASAPYGKSWNNPYTNLDNLLKSIAGTAGEHNVYVAEGTYSISTIWLLQDVQLNLIGGFPKPTEKLDAATATATCHSNFLLYRTVVNGQNHNGNSMFMFRRDNSGGGLTFKHFILKLTGAPGSLTEGALVTLQKNANNKTILIDEVQIEDYMVNEAGVIYFYKAHNAKVIVKNSKISGGRNNGLDNGGAFIQHLYGGGSANLQIEIDNCSFSDMKVRGTNMAVISIQTPITWANDLTKRTKISIVNSSFCDIENTFATIGASGAIYALNCKLDVNNCYFSNNKAFTGPAINNTNSEVTVTNSTFENNEALNYGGAIFAYNASATTSDYAKLEIDCSKFVGNFVSRKAGGTSGVGGAICVEDNINVTVQNSYFEKNHAGIQGGAIAVTKGGRSIMLKSTNNVYKENYIDEQSLAAVDHAGGAIFLSGYAQASSLPAGVNHAVDIDGDMYYGNYSSRGYGGGAIAIRDVNKPLRIVNSNFYNNRAYMVAATVVNGGGAIYIANPTNLTHWGGDNVTDFDNNKFAGNELNGSLDKAWSGITGGGSDIYVRYIQIEDITNSKMQMAQSKYSHSAWRGFFFGSGNSFSNTTTEAAVEPACLANKLQRCLDQHDVFSPYGFITTGSSGDREIEKTVCYGETPKVTLYSLSGKQNYTFTYKVKAINKAGVVLEETEQKISSSGANSGVQLGLPNTPVNDGNTYIWELQEVEDSRDMYTTAGQVTHRTTNYRNCPYKYTSTININPEPQLTASTPVALCAGSNADINATFTATNTLIADGHWSNSSTAAAWNWTGGAIVSGSNTAAPTVSAAGTYTVTVTDNNGCTNTADVVVEEHPLPTSNYTINNIVVCDADTDGKFTLSGSETGVNYQLQTAAGVNVGSAVAGTGASVELPLGSAITATATYKVLATNATTLCSVELTAQPTAYLIKDYSNLGIAADNMMCPNTSFTLTGEAATATGANSIVYAWASSTTSATAGFTTIAGATGKDYTESAGISQTTWYKRIVHFKNTNAPGIECVQETVKEVKINDFAASITSSDATICSGQTATITIHLSGGLAPWKVLYANDDPVSTGSGKINDTDGTADNSFDFTFTTKVLTATTVFNTNNIKVYDHNYCEKTLNGSVTITVNKCVDAKDDITQTPQGVAVSGNVITNDSGTGLSLTNINIGGTDYPVPSTGAATATIPGVGTIVIDKDGNYTFTPDANYAGGHVPYITYTVKDTSGNTDTARLKINVIPNSGDNNNDPIANNDNMRVSSDATSPTTTNILVNDSDPDGDALHVSWCEVGGNYTDSNGASLIPPIGTPSDIYEMQNGVRVKVGTLTVKANGDASFVPANGFVGSIPVNYTASDGTASQEATLTIESLPVDQAPAVDANDDLKAAYMGKIISINPLANDNIVKGGGTLAVKTVDIPNADGSSFTTVNLPSTGTASYPIEGKGTIVVHSDGSVDFVPLNGFVGSVVLPYTATNGLSGASEATDKANMVFTSLNTVEAKDDITQTPQNVAVSGDVTLNDTGKESTMKLTKINIGANEFDFSTSVTSITQNISRAGEVIGSITIADNGEYTFTPATDKVGKVPDISYTVTTPGGLTSSAKLKINVIPTTAPGNNPPVVNDDIAETEDGTPITVNLLANDSDPDGDALSVSSATGLDASGSVINISSNSGSPTTVYDANGNEAGTAYFDANGKIVFAPKKGFTGNVPFEYTATDGTLSNTGKVNIRVVPAGSTNGVYAVDDAVVGPAGSAMSVYPVDNDSNTNGGAALSVKSITIGDETIALPTSGSVERTIAGKGKIIFNSDGSVSFTPEAGFIGTYDVPYVATNGVATDTAVIHFTSVKKKSCGFLRSNRNVTRQLKP